MHDINFIRDNPDLFDELLNKRFIDPKSNEIILLDKKKRDILTKSQELRAERKNLSSSFANLIIPKSCICRVKKDNRHFLHLMESKIHL